ncbi:MAG: penicillin-binding protein 2 [Candidatus Omnitrophica bacterium]|nr:penicillin-binding protein 2 [Candidatus Omnitrophota bacterium]
MRIKFINIALSLLFLFLGIGLFNLEIFQGAKFKLLSDKNCIRLVEQPGTRGKILDRNGEVIVDSYLSYDLLLQAMDTKSAYDTIDGISRLLETDPAVLKKRFKRNFIGISVPTIIATNIGINKAIALEELKADFPNIIVYPHPLRHYPYGTLASHALGYLSEIDHWRLTKLEDYGYKTKDIVGYTGVEEKYDYYLRQEEGGLAMQVDHRGSFVRTLGFKPPQSGQDIQLTLDLRIQKIAEEAFSQRKGSCIIMDPYSGEILAIISAPNFDPSVFVERPGSSLVSDIFRDQDHRLVNRSINGLYPAASVFKLVVATAALEEGKIVPSRTFVCTGKLHIGRREFACWNTHGAQDLIGAIAHSCDVYFYHTGLLVGPQGIHDYALMFGFGKPTGSDLSYESLGQVPDPLWKKLHSFKNWYDGDTANFSIGQGELLVTPLQIVRMMAVFANEGSLVSPFIVKVVAGRDVSFAKKKAAKMHLKKNTIELVRQGLHQVVIDSSGTAGTLASLGVSVAGKTGTAQVSRGSPHGWFSGFFPFDKPRFVICVFLEHGGSGGAAVLVAKQIIDQMVRQGLV